MDARQAAHTLEVIRTLMERTCQYQLLTARAGLAAGCLAGVGALLFLFLDAGQPRAVRRRLVAGVPRLAAGHLHGHGDARPGARRARLVAAGAGGAAGPGAVAVRGPGADRLLLRRGKHLWLPGVWMLCYGQGALATAAYAPRSIRWLGVAFLLLGAADAVAGAGLGRADDGPGVRPGARRPGRGPPDPERREASLRLHRSVA